MSLPTGYTSRRGKLALCVKVHRGPTGEECADVAEDFGFDVAARAEVAGVRMAWGLPYLERIASEDCETYGLLERWAVEDVWPDCEELARELFGRRELFRSSARVCGDGRSGGWLVLARGPDADDAREALATVAAGETVQAEPGERLLTRYMEARELLAALERFRVAVAEWVADHPRRVAWQACSLFERESDELRASDAESAARAELADATSALAERVRAVTLHTGEGFSVALDELVPALQRYDAARAAAGGSA